MSEPEPPADSLRKSIADEEAGKFAALDKFREEIQTEIQLGTPEYCILRHLKKTKNVEVSRYSFSRYLQHIGLKKRPKRGKPKTAAKPPP